MPHGFGAVELFGKAFVSLPLSSPKGKPFILPVKLKRMATSNEISLVLGLIISGLFFLQYKRYETQAKKEEMLDAFLKD